MNAREKEDEFGMIALITNILLQAIILLQSMTSVADSLVRYRPVRAKTYCTCTPFVGFNGWNTWAGTMRDRQADFPLIPDYKWGIGAKELDSKEAGETCKQRAGRGRYGLSNCKQVRAATSPVSGKSLEGGGKDKITVQNMSLYQFLRLLQPLSTATTKCVT
jgi:hypothetical protein